MSRTFYKFALYFNILVTAVGMYYGYKYFQLGEKIVELPDYPNLFIIDQVLILIAIGILLTYFHHKKFKHAFIVLVIATIISLFHFITGYTWLLGRPWGTLDQVSFLALTASDLAFGVVLLYSNARTKPYLKKLGIVICIFLPVVIVLYIIVISTTNAALRTTLSDTFRWIELIGSFIPILYVLHFFKEMNETPLEDTAQLAR
ncbi:MAG: hypothetical protein ABJP45_16665 [Cyclobacteriaceae bacterium]